MDNMSDDEKQYRKIPSNEEIIDELTKDLASMSPSQPADDKTSNESFVEHDQDDSEDTKIQKEDVKPKYPFDDYVNEEELKVIDKELTEEEKQTRKGESEVLKQAGNEEFKTGKFLESILTYTKALKLCPLEFTAERSILYSNRAASKLKLEHKNNALEDCSKAIELNPSYVKALLRRAKIYEELEKLDEALEDYKKLESLDPSNMDVKYKIYVLKEKIDKRNEELKAEMLSKLKDLGNLVLKPFGLSTDNFQLNKNPDSEGYSVNFVQNRK